MAEWTDGYWWSNDGLRLHFRDYAGPSDRPPIICLPGLTRNARDFAAVADRLAGEWRLICVDLRGRGESAYSKDPMTYVPLVYLQDIEALLKELAINRFVAFGTSLGGLLTMLLASTGAKRLAGAMLNDIGPVLEPAGLDRIKTHVGRQAGWPTWLHAARALGDAHRATFPDFTLDDWLAHAKRLCRVNAKGRINFDYDMHIADPFRLPGGETGFDAWAAFEALKAIPAVLLHGELSDLLSARTVREVETRMPLMECVTVPRVGHAPTLMEAEAVDAIDRLLARVLQQG
jgi:pimeloyl-ACP methyl ester carboxylesterase